MSMGVNHSLLRSRAASIARHSDETATDTPGRASSLTSARMIEKSQTATPLITTILTTVRRVSVPTRFGGVGSRTHSIRRYQRKRSVTGRTSPSQCWTPTTIICHNTSAWNNVGNISAICSCVWNLSNLLLGKNVDCRRAFHQVRRIFKTACNIKRAYSTA